jgi:choline dehydrogenase-like flavoprotein
MKKFFLEHLVIAHCNLHSDHSPYYEISLKHDMSGKSIFQTKKVLNKNSKKIVNLSLKGFKMITKNIGCYILNTFVQHSGNFDSYHLGGSFPMRNKPKLQNDTDIYGRLIGFKNVHIIDSSIFPSLPATTMGLVSMANAYRIASEVDL